MTDLTHSRFSVPHTIDFPQTLDVQMQHLSGLFPLITSYRRLYLQRGKP